MDQFLALAATLPEEVVLRELEKAIIRYKESKNEESKRNLLMYCQLVSSKVAIEAEGLVKVITDINSLADTHSKMKNANLQ